MQKFERIIYLTVILIITTLSVIVKYSHDKKAGVLRRQYDNKLSNLNYQFAIEQISEDFELDSTQLLIDENKDTVSLLSLSQNPKLILYLNPYSCNVCLDSLFIQIQSIFISGKCELAIISSNEGYRDLLVHLANKEYAYPHYCLLSDLDIPACDEGVPFLFWLDRHFIAKHILIPDNRNTDKTKGYLHVVKNLSVFSISDNE